MAFKCVKIKAKVEDTEDMLNKLAKQGWKVICSYAYDNCFLILERKGW
jgi:hypothetical protein